MKSIITSILAIAFVAVSVTSLFAQSTLDGGLEERMAKGTILGSQIGSLICENANGERVLCSGDLEETVLGIATNVPYVTVNKPLDSNGSKFIFDAIVSTANGQISKGDYLSASKGGTLARAASMETAYAVAIEDASESKKIKVKVLNR